MTNDTKQLLYFLLGKESGEVVRLHRLNVHSIGRDKIKREAACVVYQKSISDINKAMLEIDKTQNTIKECFDHLSCVGSIHGTAAQAFELRSAFVKLEGLLDGQQF
jgi:hypothetical protein